MAGLGDAGATWGARVYHTSRQNRSDFDSAELSDRTGAQVFTHWP